MAIAESPLESLDGLCWLWIGPVRQAELQMPLAHELLSEVLTLAHQADTIALTDAKLAKAVRLTVRSALSARGFGRFKEHVQTIQPVMAPMLRRQIRRCEGLGITIPERLLGILDDAHPPVIEVAPRVRRGWRRKSSTSRRRPWRSRRKSRTTS